MLKSLKSGCLLPHLFVFVIFNLGLYLFIAGFHRLVPFSRYDYFYNAHHYLADPRVSGQPFDFLSALAQYDAQWYLKIMSSGYSYSSEPQRVEEKDRMENLTYAFFPAYPILGRAVDYFFNNPELSAFILAQVLLLANFVSLYWVISKLFSVQVALKTAWLVFSFPFSIFFRSYYAEPMLLLLVIWLAYFLSRRRLVIAAVILGLINVTKGTVALLNPYFLVCAAGMVLARRIKLTWFLTAIFLVVLPPAVWMGFNYLTTGRPLFFQSIQSAWHPGYILPPLLNNIRLLLLTFYLPLHSVHASQIDNFVAVLSVILLVKSFRVLPRVFWWTSLCVFLTPFLVRDLASFSRYQSVAFPLFLYLAITLKPRSYYLLLSVFSLLLFLTSLFFVNWYWIG